MPDTAKPMTFEELSVSAGWSGRYRFDKREMELAFEAGHAAAVEKSAQISKRGIDNHWNRIDVEEKIRALL